MRDLEAALEAARAEARSAEAAARAARDALSPALEDPGALADREVPGRARIATAEGQRQQLESEGARLADDVRRLGERRDAAAASLAGLSEAGAGASREELDQAREARHAAWTTNRRPSAERRAFSGCQAISMAITVALPAPVTSFNAIRIRTGAPNEGSTRSG